MKAQTYRVTYPRCITVENKQVTEEVTRMIPLVDRFETAISVGQIISYPVRRRSFMSMEVAKIERISRRDKDRYFSPYNTPILHCVKPNGKRVVIERWDRCVIVSDPSTTFGF